MEDLLHHPQQLLQQRSTSNKVELRGEELSSGRQGSVRHPSREEKSIDVVCQNQCQGGIVVIDLDSDDPKEFAERSLGNANIQKSSSAERGGAGTYSGRLRPRRATSKKYHGDFIPHDRIDCLDDYEREGSNELQNAEPLPRWTKKKQRTPRRGPFERSHRGFWASEQASRPKNLLLFDGTELSQGVTQHYSRKGRDNQCNSELKYVIPDQEKLLGQSDQDKSVAVPSELNPRTRRCSSKRVSCNGSKSATKGKMVTRTESSPRNLSGHQEGPATPMKPTIRKRRRGIPFTDASLEYHSVNALTNLRSLLDGSERLVHQQTYQPSWGDEASTEQSGQMVKELFVGGGTQSGTAQFPGLNLIETLDALASGRLGRPSEEPVGSQFRPGGSPSYTVHNCGPDVAFRLGSYSRDAVSSLEHGGNIVSEPSATDSLETVLSDARQTSDDDYHPPAGHSALYQVDSSGNPFSTSCCTRAQRNSTERVTSFSALFSPATPSKVIPPRSNTGEAISDHQHGSLRSRISSSVNVQHTGNLNLHENLPHDGILFDEEEESQELFDLNELPDKQPRKNLKARKKHRPKVFREGRPYRARKSKHTEDDISKTKATRVQKVAEKPRVRKKRATAELQSTRDESLEKRGSHTQPIAANSGWPRTADGAVSAHCGENQCGRSPEGCSLIAEHLLQRREKCSEDVGMHSSQVRSTMLGEMRQRKENYIQAEGAHTPGHEDFIRRRESSIFEVTETNELTSFPRTDCSPLSNIFSTSPNLSRKRIGELENPSNLDVGGTQPGARRELFKKPRGKSITAVGVKDLVVAEKEKEHMIVARADTSATSAAGPLIIEKRTYTGTGTCQELDTTEQAQELVSVDLGSVPDTGLLAAGPKNYAEISPAVVCQESQGRTAEVGMEDRSTTISQGNTHRMVPGRLRAAARAQIRHPVLSNFSQKLPINRLPSVPRLLKQTDLEALMDQIIDTMARLDLDHNALGLEIVPHINPKTDLVPYKGLFMPIRRKKPRARVMLDGEDKRVWRLLMAKGTEFEDECPEKDAPKQWEKERIVMKDRAEKFINRMHLVQGDRRFSVWKGSVVDSIVGAFLTQNVSDHLSSSAFMCLAARFPVPRKKKAAAETLHETTITEVYVEEDFEICEELSEVPGSRGRNAVDPVEETSLTSCGVEDAFDSSEKLSVIGGQSSACSNKLDHIALLAEVTDCNRGLEQTIQTPHTRVASTLQGQTSTCWSSDRNISTWTADDSQAEKLLQWTADDVRELSSISSSKGPHSSSDSCLPNMLTGCNRLDCVNSDKTQSPTTLVRSLSSQYVQTTEQANEKPSREEKDSSPVDYRLQAMPFMFSIDDHQGNIKCPNCPVALLGSDVWEVSDRALHRADRSFEEDPQLQITPFTEQGSPILVVDLLIAQGEEVLIETSLQHESVSQGVNNFRLYRSGGHVQEESHHTTPVCETIKPIGFDVNNSAVEVVEADTNCVTRHLNSSGTHPGSSIRGGLDINCATYAVATGTDSVSVYSNSFDACKLPLYEDPMPVGGANCSADEVVGTDADSVIACLNSCVTHKLPACVSVAVDLNCSADEVDGAETGVVYSRSSAPVKLPAMALQPGSGETGVNAAGVIFSSDSFDRCNSSENMLVLPSAEVSENQDDRLQASLPHNQDSSNLHNLKSSIRNKRKIIRKGTHQKNHEFNMNYSSELVESLSSNQEKGVQGQKKLSFIGLTGIARARLEQAQITSKVSVDWEAVRLKYAETSTSEEQSGDPHAGCKSFGSSNVENGVDWDAVRLAELEDIADVIKERGMNNVLAGRIKIAEGSSLDHQPLSLLTKTVDDFLASLVKFNVWQEDHEMRFTITAPRSLPYLAFLERVQKEHGSVDLEWLRTVSVEEAKSFLLSIRGLGLKSVECIRLLTLHHLAFPVDTNVGRICVRLGWVPLEPLPEELQLHLLELYPVQETIQKYLWPRLCSLDQRTLYELHYQMITFGKVFCTKSRPNCNACPMRDDCQHFASALASARLALPAAAHDDTHSTNSERLSLPAAAAEFNQKAKLALPPSEHHTSSGEEANFAVPSKQDASSGEEESMLSSLNTFILSQKPCEPIIEEPSTPERVTAHVNEIDDIEQLLGGDNECDTFVGVSSQRSELAKDTSTDIEIVLPAETISNMSSTALVLLPPGIASLPVPKLKNVGRLRTVHYVYELPDHHPLVREMDAREPDDPCVYLLAIWSPGETPEAPPVLDDLETNGTCEGFNSCKEETVKGTVLIPCRTAMRGIFPLNGTYFQVNECKVLVLDQVFYQLKEYVQGCILLLCKAGRLQVFADHASSLQPIEVPRTLLWNLRRRFVYFGTSVTTIFKGLSTEEIQACFWRGYVCVRGFDSITRSPRPLVARLHFPASKMIRKQRGTTDSNAEVQN